MLVYTSYPTFSPPTLYPAQGLVPNRYPTARERYLHALADVQSARERYISELEEQRILANLHQQEALRQAEIHHQELLYRGEIRQRAAQSRIARRRAGRACIGSCCQPALLGPTTGPHIFAVPCVKRHLSAVEPQRDPRRTVEELFEALLSGGGDQEQEDQKLKEQRVQEARAGQEREAMLQNISVRILSKLDAIRKEAQVTQESSTERAQPASAPAGASLVSEHFASAVTSPHENFPAYTFAVPFSRQAGLLRKRNPQERSHSTDTVADKEALATIEALRTRLQALKDGFTFPEHLDFRERSDGHDSEVPALLYTPSNSAVHAYMHELTKLLMNADGVSSGGSHRVREERRTFVRGLEEDIKVIEARVDKIWGKKAEDATKVPHEAQSSQHAVQPTAVSVKTEQASNEHEEQRATPLEIPEEDEQRVSDLEPSEGLEAIVDSRIPASPSVIVISHPAAAADLQPYFLDDESPSGTMHETVKPRASQQVIALSDEDISPTSQRERTAGELEETQMIAKDPPATATEDPNPEAGHTHPTGHITFPPEPTHRQTSEARQEDILACPEVDATNTTLSHSTDKAAVADLELAAPPALATNSTPAPEAFGVVYPSSPSSNSGALEANVSAEHDTCSESVSGDETAAESLERGAGATSSLSMKREPDDDGFELL